MAAIRVNFVTFAVRTTILTTIKFNHHETDYRKEL